MVSAEVYWTGDSGSSNGEHVYSMSYESLPRIGELIEIKGNTLRVTQVKYTSQGRAKLYTKQVK